MIPQYNGFEKKKFSSAREILPAGGYVGKILKAEVVSFSWGNQLQISFDITEGDYKNFFKKDWEANTNENKKWRGVLKLTLPTGDGSEQDGWKVNSINNLAASLEESNSGYTWDWDERDTPFETSETSSELTSTTVSKIGKESPTRSTSLSKAVSSENATHFLTSFFPRILFVIFL